MQGPLLSVSKHSVRVARDSASSFEGYYMAINWSTQKCNACNNNLDNLTADGSNLKGQKTPVFLLITGQT